MDILSSKTRDLLRSVIEDRIDEVPDNRRVIIQKDVLENLIFDTYVLEDSKTLLKLPVWTGTFLRRIDLTNVSFDNVFWGSYDNCILIEELSLRDREMFRYILSNSRPKQYVHLEGTNAVVDFSKAFDVPYINKDGRTLHIDSCNISGIDLSQNTFEGTYYISNSNLSFSNLNVGTHSRLVVINSNLESIDLSKLKIGVESITMAKDIGGSFGKSFINVNLSNTKINFISDDSFENSYDSLKSEIEKGNLYGCFINGKSINKYKSDEKDALDLINSAFDNKEYNEILEYEQYSLDLKEYKLIDTTSLKEKNV